MATKIVISKVSEPYADALLELAKANNCVDAITADVNDLLTFLTSVPLLASYFENPVISMANKKELVNTVMGSKLNPYMLKFLQFLIDRRRIAFFETIGERYLELVYEFADIKVVTVKTVVPLSYRQERRIIRELKEFTSAKEIRLIREVDKSILGGLVIKIDSQVIDISQKGQLRQISSSLDTTLVF